MLKSYIQTQKGTPRIFIEGKETCPMAYTTYFEERSGYRDFIQAGYRLFFVNATFTTAPINPQTTFSPFRVGIFEDPDHPDYSEFEDAVRKILTECPDAVIFPRINISMPKWWVDSHPEDVILTADGTYREVMFSDAFRKDASALLLKAMRHMKEADYASRIGGWMICGANTQEWIYHSFGGNLDKVAEKYFRQWVKETYGEDNAVLPTKEEFVYQDTPEQTSENAKRYGLFCNLAMAQTIEHFAKVVKEEINYQQIVGTFYGYIYEARTALFGSYGLRALLDSKNLDFFSSPNSYVHARAFGMDWADMMPVDSIKAHGKLPFIECDIRTYLTVGVQQARPGEYPDHIYTTNGVSVWSGPPTAELSRKGLEKCFAHQLTKASAVWWFDMWGGWYDDPMLMGALKKAKEIYDGATDDVSSALKADVVFFADEQSYANMLANSPQMKVIEIIRTALGKTGIPFDSCMVEDAPALLKNYKAAIFPFAIPSEAGKKAMALCEEMNIPYLRATCRQLDFTVEILRKFLTDSHVHVYSDEMNVVYVGNGYVGLHSAQGGEKTITLPKATGVSCLYGADYPSQITDKIHFTLEENATALFAIKTDA